MGKHENSLPPPIRRWLRKISNLNLGLYGSRQKLPREFVTTRQSSHRFGAGIHMMVWPQIPKPLIWLKVFPGILQNHTQILSGESYHRKKFEGSWALSLSGMLTCTHACVHRHTHTCVHTHIWDLSHHEQLSIETKIRQLDLQRWQIFK